MESTGSLEDTAAAAAGSVDSAHVGSTVSKREDYLHWDDYFMGVAFLSAKRSKGRWQMVPFIFIGL